MLPDSIPTVRVTGRYLLPDGTPLSGQVVFRAPSLITFPDSDVILGGPVTAPLDAQGAFTVTLPATDAPGMNPTGWSYAVAEQLAGVANGRTYQILLPADQPAVDIADIAPTDPTTPTYVAVRGDSAYEVAVKQGFKGTVEQWLASLVGPQGPQGPQGRTGAPGSQVYTGSTAPPATLGVDGDVYTQYTTTTNLGVTTTTVALWSKTAGAWARVGGDVRGAAWYVNAAGTPSSGVPVGDMLLRSDTGDVYQRGASGWELKGNIRGPQGAKGDQGPAGAPGVVQSVNGISAAAVVLDAAAVRAVPDTAPGAPGGVATLDASGKVPASQLPAASGGGVQTVNGKGPDASGNVALVAADVGAVATTEKGAASGVATLGADGILATEQRPTYTAAQVGALATTARGAANGVASLGADSKVPAAQLPYDGWRPADLGMKAWAFDPAVAQSGGRVPLSGSFRITAVPVREATSVSSIVYHVFGYEGTGLDAGSRAGIFNANGARLAQTADMVDTAVMTDVHNAGGQTVTCALTAPVTLQPGIYYVCFRFVIGTSANAPVLMTADSTGACPVTTLNTVRPFGVISGMTSWPSTFSPSAIETDPIKFWAALA